VKVIDRFVDIGGIVTNEKLTTKQQKYASQMP
jgi:hypothetical protein